MPLFRGRKKLNYESVVLASKPFAYYPMRESIGGGSTEIQVQDVAGRGYHMVGGRNLTKPATLLQGGGFTRDAVSATCTTAVMKQECIYLLGANDTGATDLYNMLIGGIATGWTIEFWIDNITNKGGTAYPIVFGLGSSVVQLCTHDTTTTDFRVNLRSTAADWQQKTGVMNATGWNQFVLTYKSNAGAGVDAIARMNTVYGSPQCFSNIDDLVTNSTYKSVVLLGLQDYDANHAHASQGSIAHVAFYDRVLPDDEIALHYNIGRQ